jgi:hypothetical protein
VRGAVSLGSRVISATSSRSKRTQERTRLVCLYEMGWHEGSSGDGAASVSWNGWSEASVATGIVTRAVTDERFDVGQPLTVPAYEHRKVFCQGQQRHSS